MDYVNAFVAQKQPRSLESSLGSLRGMRSEGNGKEIWE